MPLYNPPMLDVDQLQGVQFGTSTPTVDLETNLSNLIPGTSWYARLGNMVYVNSIFQVQATTAATCSFRVTLPVGMQDFTNINQLIGGGFNSPGFSFDVFAISEWQTDSVHVRWTAPDTALYSIVVWAAYFLE